MTTLLKHPLTLWGHAPRNNNWNDNSSTFINKVNTAEALIALNQIIASRTVLANKCMMFFMLDNIEPLYEHPQNASGGAFSYRVNNAHVSETWNTAAKALATGTLASNEEAASHVTGITLSPKGAFCVIKIWMSSCHFTDPSYMAPDIPCLISAESRFTPHYK